VLFFKGLKYVLLWWWFLECFEKKFRILVLLCKIKMPFLKKNEGRVEEFERKDKTVEIK